MIKSSGNRNPLMAYRELASISTTLLAACERGETDAILAEIGRREEVQKKIELMSEDEIAEYRDEILPVLEKISDIDKEIEPKIKNLLGEVGEKIRSASNSRKLLELYRKEPQGDEARFYDKQG